MDKVKRAALLLLIFLITQSIIVLAGTASAQAISKPAVPQFTVELAGPSFDIPPTYSLNQSNGLFITNEGSHFEYSTVKVVIQNQPFINQTNLDYLYYNVRIKPHNYADLYWVELFSAGANGYPVQTSSNYTIIPIPIEETQVYPTVVAAGASTDIQVEAMIGHICRNQTLTPYPYPYVFFGETSGWSNIQTVTVPPITPILRTASVTPSPTPTQTPNLNANEITMPLNVFILVIAVLAIAIVALSVLLLRRH